MVIILITILVVVVILFVMIGFVNKLVFLFSGVPPPSAPPSLSSSQYFFCRTLSSIDEIIRARGDSGSRRTAICMWYDEGAQSYGDINFEINKAYCARYGYDLIRSSRRRTDRVVQWECVSIILTYLSVYEELVWVDADAFFRFDRPIESMLRQHADKDFIFSADMDVSHCFHGTLWCAPQCARADAILTNINAGVFVVRATTFARRLLEYWLYDEQLERDNPVPIWPEQATLRLLYLRNWNDVRRRSVVMPYGKLQTFNIDDDEAPLLHFAGKDKETRVRESTKYLRELERRGHSQMLFHMTCLESPSQMCKYALEIERILQEHPLLVFNPNLAAVHIVLYSDETNYPVYGRPSPHTYLSMKEAFQLAPSQSHQDVRITPVLTFFHTTPLDMGPLQINAGYACEANDRNPHSDLLIFPPAIKTYEDNKYKEPHYFATFKGNKNRSDVRRQSFDALTRFHNGTTVVICESNNTMYDYDDLLQNTTFSFVLEGDLQWSYRMTEVLTAGSIPVFITSDYTAFPYPDIVDWESISVSIPLEEAGTTTMQRLTAKIIEAPIMKRRIRDTVTELAASRSLQVMALTNALMNKLSIPNRCDLLSRQLKPLGRIPRKIHMSWKDKNFIGNPDAPRLELVERGAKRLRDNNPDFTTTVSDDADVEQYLRASLADEDYKLISDRHVVEKVDLWRLLKIYREGGVYSDVDRLCDQSFDELLRDGVNCVLPIFRDVDFAQDIMISAPGNPIYKRAIYLNLARRKAGERDLYYLGPSTYMHAVSEALLGFQVPHGCKDVEIWKDLRAVLHGCPQLDTYLEKPLFDTFTYRGPSMENMSLEKDAFYNFYSVKSWTNR